MQAWKINEIKRLIHVCVFAFSEKCWMPNFSFICNCVPRVQFNVVLLHVSRNYSLININLHPTNHSISLISFACWIDLKSVQLKKTSWIKQYAYHEVMCFSFVYSCSFLFHVFLWIYGWNFYHCQYSQHSTFPICANKLFPVRFREKI